MTPPLHNRSYVLVLSALLAAFLLRVLAQLMQFYSDVAWLPPFEAWAAGGLPYPLLVGLQIIIITVAVDVIRKLARNALSPQRKWAIFFFAAGGLYFIAMAARLVAGVTILADIPWFAASLPSAFHLVLAGFILTLGRYHWSNA